ncbi:MAG: hypothetical protein ACI4D8_08065 [Wujia sp.]
MKKFELLLLKNTLAVAIPAIGVFVALIFLLMKYPVFENVNSTYIDNGNIGVMLPELYEKGHTNVLYEAENLYYTGFDYFVDQKKEGAYYYCIQDNQIYVFLIDTKNPEQKLDKVELKGKIIKDTIAPAHIMSELAGDNDVYDNLVEGILCPYVISEPDYPHKLVVTVYLFFFSPIIICVLIFIYTIVIWVNPSIHSQSRQLEVYGNVPEIIKDLNKQLKYHLFFRKHNVYITKDYVVVNYLTRTDVIRIDFIRYLSKNLTDSNVPFRKKKVYRLTMSNPDKIFYEVDFTSESLCDNVVKYIRTVNKAQNT